jgi:hypothetical protein
MKQKLQKYLDDCIKLRIPPFFEIVLSSLRRFVSRTKRFRPLDYACPSDYYSLRQRTVQSTVADCTVHCNESYSPLPQTVIIFRLKSLGRPRGTAYSSLCLWYDI